jgi:hypothetical protein
MEQPLTLSVKRLAARFDLVDHESAKRIRRA